MTKLHETIHEVRMVFLQTLVDGLLLEAKLERMEREKVQRDLEKPKVSEFPRSFIVAKDERGNGQFTIGLHHPLNSFSELPLGFSGRACYSQEEIRQIIRGLQTLLGD